MARCWKVLQEQIWRRHPVNKEPAETSCEQHGAEMCDFMRRPAGDRQSVIRCCYPLPYCYWIWPGSTAGKLPLRKCKDGIWDSDVHFSWCLLWSISFLFFWDKSPECLTSDETRNHDGFWFAMRTVLRRTRHFLTDEAELGLTSTFRPIDFFFQNRIFNVLHPLWTIPHLSRSWPYDHRTTITRYRELCGWRSKLVRAIKPKLVIIFQSLTIMS